MSNVKTINLTGGETEVIFGQKFKCYWVKNMGSSDIYASLESGAEPEADGVITIGAGASARVSTPNLFKTDTLYLTGSGKAQIVGGYSVHCPFKTSQEGGDKDKFVIFAEIPFDGKLDGYGYTIIRSQNVNNISETNGLYLGGAAFMNVQFTTVDPTLANIIKMVFDFKLDVNPNTSADRFLLELGDSNGYAIIADHNISKDIFYVGYYTQKENVNLWGNNGFVNDGEWHTMEVILTNKEKDLQVKIDDKIMNAEASFADITASNKMCFGGGKSLYGYIKNVKLMVKY